MTAPRTEDGLREAFRAALAQFIDPDDDTMPYCNRIDGGYTWTPADGVIDRLMKVVNPLARMYLQAMTDLGRATDKLDKLRELVGNGPPSGSAAVEGDWERGYISALDQAEKILDGKESTP